MISGIEFSKLCSWNTCNRYQVKFDPSLISEGDFIFVNTDMINKVIAFFKSNTLPKVNLICHNSDLSFNNQMYEELSGFVKHIYSINCIVGNELITKIPLGFSDRLITVLSNLEASQNKKSLLYMNFNIHSNRIQERTECRGYFKQFEWVTFEDLVPETQYYKSLNDSKYSVCPIGAGLDTHRFYESIFLNTVPIVKRNDISDLHSKFPCIIVNNWSEIDKEYLDKNYQVLYNRMLDWKKKNPDWLEAKTWL